jgi:two-component sensor histidine kinase
MVPEDGRPPAIVEPQPSGNTTDLTLRALQQRIRQQEILAELGVSALQGLPFEELIAETARLAAQGLRAEFSKILEYIPAEGRLLVRAGIGWEDGIVGVASIGADLESPAGFALRTGKPVISNHLENEQRFRTPALLQEHGIHRAMNVILQGDGQPYGVLEVDSRSEEKFVEQDLAFLQGAANILGMAIERQRHEERLKSALERHQFLLKEMNHRVQNSLTIVGSMLRLQASDVKDPVLTQYLEEASNRVTAVARAHDLLSRAPNIERMDVGEFVKAVCKDLAVSMPTFQVSTQIQGGIEIATDRAISCALIVNELITNAVKYGYKGETGGKLAVSVASAGEQHFNIGVRDEGAGLPDGFDPGSAKSLGMRIINSFCKQLNGHLSVRRRSPGTEFIIAVPLRF